MRSLRGFVLAAALLLLALLASGMQLLLAWRQPMPLRC
jgi:hypothetical protein